MQSAISQSPYLLYSDGKGNIFEDLSLYALGRAGWDAFPVETEDWIVLPKRSIGLYASLVIRTAVDAASTTPWRAGHWLAPC